VALILKQLVTLKGEDRVKNQLYKLGIVVTSVACVFLFANCVTDLESGTPIPGKVTGGGRIDVDGGGQANFGFNASGCDDPANPTGRFNYLDMQAAYPGGVKMNGTVLEAYQCDPNGDDCDYGAAEACPAGAYLVSFGYRSTNPKEQGPPPTGTGYVCMIDNGEGSAADADRIGISIDGGPFDGYQISGDVRGNVQGHPCPIELP